MALPPQPFGNMVDRQPQDVPQDGLGMEVPVAAPPDFSGGAQVTMQDDGSALIEALSAMEGADEQELQAALIPFDANLADFLDDDVLDSLGKDLISAFEEDLESRSEWEEVYNKGLDLLGVKMEDRDQPFEGASGVTHPVISESVVQFQAQAYKELLPPGGPVKSRVVGAETPEVVQQAARVKNYMNYLILDEMEEYDSDMDQMLFYLPLSGSTFKKVYFDPVLQRPVSKFVAAQDVVVPYETSDLKSAPRITHVLNMGENDIRKMQVSGFYRDVDLPSPGYIRRDDVEEKVDELQGVSPSGYTDDVYTLLEVDAELDIEGFEDPSGVKLPYLVTLDRDSGNILSIRRNYREQDPVRRRLQHFTHYKFLPGLGFYGFGLTHMLGNLGRAATSILRQLIDAGTLANLPAGFKAKGIRVAKNDEPLQPGEWRDIDAPGGAIRDALLPLPYKEPSATLANLLGALVDAGRRFVSFADQQMADGNAQQETPVGTTMAMLERGTKVMSAIHKRLHNAQKQEFKILARVIADNAPMQYPYNPIGGEPAIKAQDFDGRVDVIPVSDPNIFSMAQRVALAQQQLQMAQAAPQMHDLRAAYMRMYQALEIQNIEELLPPPPQPQPSDAATENGAMLLGRTAQAFETQNHEAHLTTHLMGLRIPLVQQSPQQKALFYAHCMEHIAMLARQKVMQESQEMIQQAQMAAQTGAVDPQQVMQQIAQIQQALNDPEQLAAYAAVIQHQLLEQFLPEMLEGDAPPADPLVEIRQRELDLKQQEVMSDAQMDQEKLELQRQQLEQKALGEAARIELQEEIAEDRNRVNRERIEAQMMMAQQRNRGGPR